MFVELFDISTAGAVSMCQNIEASQLPTLFIVLLKKIFFGSVVILTATASRPLKWVHLAKIDLSKEVQQAFPRF